MTGIAEASAAAIPAARQPPWLYLDANVLLPQYLRAVFLELADADLVRVHWGQQVLAEVRRHLAGPRFGNKSPASIDKLLAAMARAFPDALVLGSEKLEARFQAKTHPKDAHVAAGALKLSGSAREGQGVVLVTSNIRDLPASAFEGMPVRPVRPNLLLKELLAADAGVADVLARMLERFKAPPVAKEDFLGVLENSNCGGFATVLGKEWGFDAAAR